MRFSCENIQQALILVFIFLLPTQLGTFFFLDFSYISGVRIDYLAPAVYATDIVACGIFLLNYLKIIKFWQIHWRKLSILLFFVVMNILLATAPVLALYKVMKYSELLLLFIILRSIHIDFKKVLIACISGASIELVLALLQVWNSHAIQGIFYFLGERYMNLGTPDIAKISIQGVETLRAYGSFSHPNSLAGFYLLLYTWAITFIPLQQYNRLRTLLLIVTSLLIFMSFSKIAIAVYIGMNIVYFLHKKPRKILLEVSLIAGSFLLFLALFLFTQGDPLSAEKRWTLNLNAISIIVNNIFTGVGFGNYVIEQAQFPIKYSYHFLQPVHNIVLLFIAEAGIIITSYCALILARMKNVEPIIPAALWCGAVILATGMFDHYWLTLQQNMLLIPTIFALLNKKNERTV